MTKRIQLIIASLLCTGLATASFAAPASLAPYTDNPLVEFLALQRYHAFAGVQMDASSNEHDPVTFIAGMGYFPTERISLGLYASTRGSDRKYPVRMSSMNGFGLFSDYSFAPASRWQPFGGIRLGMLDTSGPANPTSLHIAAQGGMKFAITPNIRLTAAAVINWTEEKLLDYEEAQNNPGAWDAANTDLGFEIGIRCGF